MGQRLGSPIYQEKNRDMLMESLEEKNIDSMYFLMFKDT